MCHLVDRDRIGNYLAGIHGWSQQSFAARLQWWRKHRGLSQLDLAGRAEISQRHLSFLELGRASPSRPMVLRLAEALDIPLRQHNALLLAAGFAPSWRESGLDAPELAQIASAVDRMLAKQEPFPAVAVDRHWRLLKANAAAVRLVEFLVGPVAPGHADQSGRCAGRAGRAAALSGELGRGGALLHSQRRGGRCRRRQRRDECAPGTAAGLQGCAVRP